MKSETSRFEHDRDDVAGKSRSYNIGGHRIEGNYENSSENHVSRYENGRYSRYSGYQRDDSNQRFSNVGGNYRGGYGPRRGYKRSNYMKDEARDTKDRAPRERGPLLSRELDSPYQEKLNRNYANSIFVGNLTYDCQPSDLEQFFGEVGEVIRADIITSRGHHRGMGTVEFTNGHDVNEAIRRFNGASFLGRDIFVRHDNPPPESMRAEKPISREGARDRFQSGYEVFVANLPFSINWQALKDMFKECGIPIRADVKLDRDGRSRGFGTVIFQTIEEAHAAIEQYNGYELDGRILEVKEGHNSFVNNNSLSKNHKSVEHYPQNREQAIPRTGKESENKVIYVENLPLATAKSDLFDLFETIGKVTNAEIFYHDKSGSAYVEYENEEDAKVSIKRLNNYTYGGHDLIIGFAKK